MDLGINKDRIKNEIMEIVGNFGFWIVNKNGMQGCAGYIHTPNRKIYLEVLFPSDYPKKPIILNMPRDLRQNPVFFEVIPPLIQETTDPNFHAAEVVKLIKAKLSALPAPKVKESLLDELDDELNLVKSIYNVKTVDGKKYHIRIFYQLKSDIHFEVEINYKDYPNKPQIIFHHGLKEIIGTPQALEVIRNWNTNNPPHIVQIIQEIEQRFTQAHGIEDIEKLIMIKNLTLINEKDQMLTQNLTFSVLRGDIIGVFCFNKEIPLALFRAFLGKIHRIEGEINIFGNTSIKAVRKQIKYVDFHIPSDVAQILGNMSLENILRKYLPSVPKKEAKKRVSTFLSIIGLSNRKNFKMNDLSEGERRRLIVAFSLIDLPSIALLFEPERGLNTTEKKRIWDTITMINDKYSITMFVYSTSEEIKRCHNILVLSRDGMQLGFGTINQLVGELPLYKEVIIVQFNSPKPEHIEMLGRIPGVSFIIEEREGEKYRLFTKIDPDKVIPYIFQQIGSSIYNISKEPPSLIDYVPYKRVLKKSS